MQEVWTPGMIEYRDEMEEIGRIQEEESREWARNLLVTEILPRLQRNPEVRKAWPIPTEAEMWEMPLARLQELRKLYHATLRGDL